MIGQEHDLDIEQQNHWDDHDREPCHQVQKGAHDPAALRAGDCLNKEVVVQLQTQGMRTLLGRFQKLNGVIEFERFPRQQDQLR